MFTKGRGKKGLEEELVKQLEQDDWEEEREEEELDGFNDARSENREDDESEIEEVEEVDKEDEEVESEREEEEVDEGGKRETGFLPSFSSLESRTKKILIGAIAGVGGMMLGALGLTFFLGKQPPGKHHEAAFVRQANSFLGVNQTAVGEADFNAPRGKGGAGKSVVVTTKEQKNENESSKSRFEATFGAVQPVVVRKKTKEAQSRVSAGSAPKKVKNEKGQREDIFLSFFERKRGETENAGAKSDETKGKDVKTNRSLPAVPVPPPVSPKPASLTEFCVYGIICDGGECYAETSIGRLKKGDVISGGVERVVSVTKRGVRTNVRMVTF